MTSEELEELLPEERELWNLRGDLAALADRFTKLGEVTYHGNKNHDCDRRVSRVCKATDGDIGEILIEIDTYMDWEDE